MTTRSAEAQRWFDRGLVNSYAFDHAEAIRSFERAAEADPTCAMAQWGQAFAHGPHINNPFMDEASARAAYDAAQRARAFASLRAAVALDDGLRYDEPWAWMQPVRHALGALLLEQGRLDEAEAVYRADLARHPENGWSLHGLAECLRRKGDPTAAAETERAFRAAWRGADVELTGSCFCRIGA